MFGAVRTDFGRPQPALRSVADPVVGYQCGDKFSERYLISIVCTGTNVLLLLLRIPVHVASALAFCPHATPFPFLLSSKHSFLTTILAKYEFFIYKFLCQMNLRHCDDVAFKLVPCFLFS
jgi:hypothetical protein